MKFVLPATAIATEQSDEMDGNTNTNTILEHSQVYAGEHHITSCQFLKLLVLVVRVVCAGRWMVLVPVLWASDSADEPASQTTLASQLGA